MKIYALNGHQGHYKKVMRNVELSNNVVLRGFQLKESIQLLEGSHRIACAIAAGVSVTIVLFGANEIIPHDCDDVNSYTTGLVDRSTVRELVDVLLEERGLYNQAVYDSGDYTNIKIIDASNGSGKLKHFALTHPQKADNEHTDQSEMNDTFSNPWNAFPEKVWQIMFGEKNVFESKVLVIGNSENRPAIAFSLLGADVKYIDFSDEIINQTLNFMKKNSLSFNADVCKELNFESIGDNTYDIIYSAPDICSCSDDIFELFKSYRRILKENGLLVMLDKHPFMNLFDRKDLRLRLIRDYDDLSIQKPGNKRYWRISDMSRWLLASGLRLYAFIELQAYDLYDRAWYSSVKERLDDNDSLSDLANNPLSAVPQWLVTFAKK